MTPITLPGFGNTEPEFTVNVDDIDRFGVINMLGSHGTEIVLVDGTILRTKEYSFRVHEQLNELGWVPKRSITHD